MSVGDVRNRLAAKDPRYASLFSGLGVPPPEKKEWPCFHEGELLSESDRGTIRLAPGDKRKWFRCNYAGADIPTHLRRKLPVVVDVEGVRATCYCKGCGVNCNRYEAKGRTGAGDS